MLSFSEFIIENSVNVNLTHRDISKHLKTHNWRLDPDQGSKHELWAHPIVKYKIAVPRHKGDLAPGTVRQILKASSVA